jgi:ankyrin repeat protein
MDRIATDCDVLIYQCLTIRELLAVRGCSRALVARYGPARDTLWEAVRPTRERLLDQLSASPLALVKLLDAAYDFTTDQRGLLPAFRLVCARGRTLTAQWLADRARMAHRSPTITGALGCACANGHLRTAQWLTGRFGLTAKDARAFGNHALNRASRGGFAPVVEWLVETFELTAQDAAIQSPCCMYLDTPLQNALMNGHTALAQYLVGRLEIPADMKGVHWRESLRGACKNGHMATAGWLADAGLVSAADGVIMLIDACEHGHLHVAKWLTIRFKITAADLRESNDDALLAACENGHLDVAKWLTAQFEFTVDDARANANYAVRAAHGNGHFEILKWLSDHFGITMGN